MSVIYKNLHPNGDTALPEVRKAQAALRLMPVTRQGPPCVYAYSKGE